MFTVFFYSELLHKTIAHKFEKLKSAEDFKTKLEKRSIRAVLIIGGAC